MHRLHPDDRTGRLAPVGGHDGKGPGLRPAEATVGPHELLEGRHLVRRRVIHAVDQYVRTVREAIMAAQMVSRGWVEVGEGVLSLDRVVR